MIGRLISLKVVVLLFGLVTTCACKKKKSQLREFEYGELSCPDDKSRWITHVEVGWGVPHRAYRSIPPELYVARSSIPGAGMGVFAHTFIRRHTWLGWYEGEVLTDKVPSSYLFTITRGKKTHHYIDLTNIELSNWTRWMNMPRSEREENVNVMQCRGRILFITNRDIYPGQELMYYYGHQFAMALRIYYKDELALLADMGKWGIHFNTKS